MTTSGKTSPGVAYCPHCRGLIGPNPYEEIERLREQLAESDEVIWHLKFGSVGSGTTLAAWHEAACERHEEREDA